MRFKEYLQEEYLTRYKNFEIFKNSSIKEMHKINSNGVRLLINMKTKNYYAFDFSLLHDKAYYIIASGINTEEFDEDSIVRAEADFSSGKLYIIWFKPWIWIKKIKEKDVESIFKSHGVSTIFKEKKNIKEEYETLVKPHGYNGAAYEIYKNPTMSDIKTILKIQRQDPKNHPDEFRFLVNKETGDMYAFSYLLAHTDAIKQGLKMSDPKHNKFFGCVGKLSGKLIRWSHFWYFSEKDIDLCNNLIKEKGWESKFIKGDDFFNEEYVGRIIKFTGKESEFEVFKNPSKREMAECGDVRFIADLKNKNLYISNAYNCIHNDILRAIGKNEDENFFKDVCKHNFWEHCFAGFGTYDNGKYELTHHAEGCYSYISPALDKLKSYDDSWLKQWFNVKNPIKNFNNII
jgi:hypothetical protein